MSGFVTWLGGAVTASFLLMLVVLVLRRPVTRLFGPGVAYALWLLPALRMMLPALPASWLPGETTMVFDPPRMVAVTNVQSVVPADAGGADWLFPALVVWAAGAVVYFAWQLFAHHRFLRQSLAGSALVTRAAGIEVRQCPAVAGPMATGVLRRFILLPADFTARFAPEERRLALAHETAHHCRGDLVANFAGLAMLSLHWFNPLAHLAYRAFRDDQEAACDATVLNAETAERRHAYGSAILKSASCRVPGAACALGHAGAMKRRILIMIDGRRSRTLRIGGGLLAAVLVGGGLIATASTVAAPVHHMTFIEGEGDHITITRDGQTRHATPAERRQIEHDIAQADAGARKAEAAARIAGANARIAGNNARIAGVNADRVARREIALGDVPRLPVPPRAPRAPAAPEAPVPPVPPVPGVATVPPVAPAAIRGAHRISYHGGAMIDRDAIRAQVDAAMAEARRSVADARAHMAAFHVDTGRFAAEGRAARAQAMKEVGQARAEAEQARAEARAEAAQARAEARAEMRGLDRQ